MTGPCGVGKTALIRVMAETLGFLLDEWINPTVDITKNKEDRVTSEYTPQYVNFKQWLRFSGKANLFGACATGHKFLLIEELPNITASMEDFRNEFKSYLRNAFSPMIFILSDSFSGNSSLLQLFDQQIVANQATKQVSAAINSLEFHCIGLKRSGSVKPRAKGRVQVTGKTMVANGDRHREPTLSLFHSLGKILYNKRVAGGRSASDAWYKDHLYRDAMENVPEEVYEYAHVEASTFVSFLHENFINFYANVDEVADTMQYLSDSDLVGGPPGSPYEVVTGQQSYATSLAVRGFMYPHNTQLKSRSFYAFVRPHFAQSSVASVSLAHDIR
eukprot:gene2464-2803_t